MTDWSPLGVEPAPGSPAEIRAAATRWLLEAAHQRDFSRSLRGTGHDLAFAWGDSPGATAFERAINAPTRGLDASAETLLRVAGALDYYATQLEDLQARARGLLAAVADTRTQIDAKSQIVDYHCGSGPAAREAATQREQLIARLTGMQSQATALAGSVQAAAAVAAQTVHSARTDMDGWATGKAYGPYGGPPVAGIYGSPAYDRYLGELSGKPLLLADDQFANTVYWENLDPRLQALYIEKYPEIVGNSGGVPAYDRDTANRLSVKKVLDDAQTRLNAAGRTLPSPDTNPDSGNNDQLLADLRSACYTEEQAQTVINAMTVNYQLRHGVDAQPDGHKPPAQLLIFEPDAFNGKGRAAISIGDIATAENVAMLTPGMTSDVPGYLDSQMFNANSLYAANAKEGRTAVIAYIGYQAPGLNLDVTNTDFAEEGAAQVAADINAFGGMRGTNSVYTVIAHSYGSTTAAFAYSEYGAKSDQLVLIGSPGAGPAKNVEDLNMRDGTVFVGASTDDPVTTTLQMAQEEIRPENACLPSLRWEWNDIWGSMFANGIADVVQPLGCGASLLVGALDGGGVISTPDLGHDPAGEGFGAIRFHAEADPSFLAVTSEDLGLPLAFGYHSLYFSAGKESLGNLSLISTGHADKVERAPLRPESGGHYDGKDPEAGHQPR